MVSICSRKFSFSLSLLLILFLASASAQTDQRYRCGLPAMEQRMPALKNIPGIRNRVPANKNTDATGVDYAPQSAIPVVFHILINSQQLQQIGGIGGIQQRIQSQIEVINQDFNRKNGDSSDIPAAFKPYYGDAGIQFALARTAPDGTASEGYELKVVGRDGYELFSNYASGVGFTESKYSAAGGLDAWDPTAYLNVWIVNPLESAKPSRLGGLTIPPSYVREDFGIPIEERGITVHYGAFGKRKSITDYYISGANLGRTLTHELGHYFNLRHVWGDDEGACPGDAGGNDDGIKDTPPQSKETYGDPNFPLYDICSRTGNGIMFMNYMDYTIDRAKYMFTKEQCDRMEAEIAFGGASYSLTKQPHLTEANYTATDDVTIYPNPASDGIQIFFEKKPEDLVGITLYNNVGMLMSRIRTDTGPYSFYSIRTNSFPAGNYILKLIFTNRTLYRHINVIH